MYKFILKLLAFLHIKPTITSVSKDLNNILNHLDEIENKANDKAHALSKHVMEAILKKEDAVRESTQARNIRANIDNILKDVK